MQISEIVKQTAAPKRALPYLSCLSPSQQNPQNIKPEGGNGSSAPQKCEDCSA
jgi:hypothetical protein